jgi:thiosulfate dehydrogenase
MENNKEQGYINMIRYLTKTIIVLSLIILGCCLFLIFYIDIQRYIEDAPKRKAERIAQEELIERNKLEFSKSKELVTFWKPKDIEDMADTNLKAQINYGKELIIHTAKYLGPKGIVSQSTNGMNCQNCHLEAGTKAWGNNYGSVYSTYPKYRARSGKEEDIFKRINDCLERSLNGKALEVNSREMLAIKAYIEYIGSDVPKGKEAKASGIYKLEFLARPTNPKNGKLLYATKCASCHQVNGEGVLADNKIEYVYPPLWGKNSYNHGAGLYRMSRFAGFIKHNMPQGATYQNPQLTDEEAWDIAAFVNSQERPKKDLRNDWPTITEKPADHPFGPFADTFSTAQHKYGPYKPISDFNKQNKK